MQDAAIAINSSSQGLAANTCRPDFEPWTSGYAPSEYFASRDVTCQPSHINQSRALRIWICAQSIQSVQRRSGCPLSRAAGIPRRCSCVTCLERETKSAKSSEEQICIAVAYRGTSQVAVVVPLLRLDLILCLACRFTLSAKGSPKVDLALNHGEVGQPPAYQGQILLRS